MLVVPAFAQLAPSGEHYAGRPSDTGFGGSDVGATGNLPADVPLKFPVAHGGLSIPVEVRYSANGVGAAGAGWDIPLSYVESTGSFAHRRPLMEPGHLPERRLRTSISLMGQNIDLIQDGDVWHARFGTLALVVRQDGNEWHAYDGEGRTYTFEQAAVMANSGLWLLKNITDSNGWSMVLYYELTTWPLNGGTGTAIDLIRVDYNMPPTMSDSASCAKNEISLAYLNGSIDPISLGFAEAKVLVRKNTLTIIDVLSRASCSAPFQSLRHYTFAYAPDADTALPRLQTVQMFGQAGTPEGTHALPVASYSYGSATHDGKLAYRTTQTLQIPSGGALDNISSTDEDTSANVPESGDRYAMWQTLLDFDGGGRSDFVFKKNNKLWIAKSSAGSQWRHCVGGRCSSAWATERRDIY